MPWELLNSKCFHELPYAAAKALPYFMGKIKLSYNDSQRYQDTFRFSYPEARSYGFPFATFSQIIKKLTQFGFIDPVERGGLRGYRVGYNVFRLSNRWKKFGTNDFENINWETFTSKKV